ncbi:hypothetical protein GCK72_023871 [Caenorhabditis remanei]|uniref:Uncharacterized protein n=1 Tax=Caenorhabditis remanei TaxID=31234 RepID=A0A6A5FYG4_CAERE|nr:hypothetical protein GCK72_023871 [Caenorhabditis remanei]KAF1747409.1 hypothetical protein GCK72_023871 [Caenorhabditis remanei]
MENDTDLSVPDSTDQSSARNAPKSLVVCVAPEPDWQECFEREQLMNIIRDTEKKFDDEYKSRTHTPEEVEQSKCMYFEAQQEFGYHVETWPPIPVSSTLEISDDEGERWSYLVSRITDFKTRERLCKKDCNDTVLVVVDSEDILLKVANDAVLSPYIAVIKSEDDMTPRVTSRLKPAMLPSLEGVVYVCTLKTLTCSKSKLMPFAKLCIFHKINDVVAFKSIVAERTEISRLAKMTSTIWAPFNIFDKPEIVECAAMLLGARAETCDKSFLDFVEKHCWNQKSNERAAYSAWADRVVDNNSRKNEEVEEIIGIRVEFWWNNDLTVANVKRFVEPTKEGPFDVARPWIVEQAER